MVVALIAFLLSLPYPTLNNLRLISQIRVFQTLKAFSLVMIPILGMKDAEGNKLPEGDYYYKETDLEFIEDARQALEEGKKVFYRLLVVKKVLTKAEKALNVVFVLLTTT